MKTILGAIFIASALYADPINTFVPYDDPAAPASSGGGCETIESSGGQRDCGLQDWFQPPPERQPDNPMDGGHGHQNGGGDPINNPEPATLMMGGTGLVCILYGLRRRV